MANFTLPDRYTTGEYLRLNPDWHAAESAWKSAQILRMITTHQLAPRTIAEVGCGAGEILSRIQNAMPSDATFTGYEVSPQAFELCSRHRRPGLDFKLADICAETTSYDLILAIDVFEHVEDYIGFLRKVKDRGRFKIYHIPLDMTVHMVFRATPIMQARRSVGHLHYFSKDTALATLEDTGHKIIDWFYTPGMIDIPNKSLKTRIARIPRQVMFRLNPDVCVRLLGGYSLMVLTT